MARIRQYSTSFADSKHELQSHSNGGPNRNRKDVPKAPVSIRIYEDGESDIRESDIQLAINSADVHVGSRSIVQYSVLHLKP